MNIPVPTKELQEWEGLSNLCLCLDLSC